MRYPHQFYYKQTQSTIHYTRTPTGSLAIKELVEGKPCWVAPTLPRVEKPKSLILADWTASAWSLEKTECVKDKLTELMNEGWAIYLWQNGSVNLMNKQSLSNLDDSNIRQAITLASSQEIIKAAVIQNKLTQDAVQVLDDYWINHLVSGRDEPGPRELRVSELPTLTPEIVDHLASVLNTTTPALTKIIKDEISVPADQKTSLLKNKWKDIPVEEDYLRISLLFLTNEAMKEQLNSAGFSSTSAHHPFEKIQTLFLDRLKLLSLSYLSSVLNTTPNLKKIALGNCTLMDGELQLQSNCLQQLEEIVLSSSNISLNSLQSILVAAPHLKKIYLSNCQTINGELELQDIGLQQLEEIYLSHSNISLNSLQSILGAASHLKKIDLRGYKTINGELELPINCLQQLEEINLFNSNISINSLKSILAAAPHLKKIDLSEYKTIDGELELRGISLQQLEMINLSKINISLNSLQSILVAAPHLKKIYLGECKTINGELELPINCLQQLEEIYLSESNISINSLQSILVAAPHLKKIDLGHCKTINGELELRINSLQQLEEIYLSYSNISLNSLRSILGAASHLKKIDLSLCTKINGELELQDISLQQLEEINLWYSNISLNSLQSILVAAPHLKKIYLSECKTINGELELPINCLQQLEEINLSYSNISLNSLKSILVAAPHLKKINLRGCQTINGELELQGICLHQLEEIDLSESNISLNNLQSILVAAPYLKTINLSVCQTINGELELKDICLQQLEEINLFNSNISINSLQSILGAAPHLKKIDLSECKIINGELELQDIALQQLEEIDLSQSNILLNILKSILGAAPHLKKIDLSLCTKINGELELQDISLQQLEEINLWYSNISINILKSILGAAPHLKKINLRGCQTINGELELQDIALQQLEEIYLWYSNISLNSLKSILGAAPHLKKINLRGCQTINGELKLPINCLQQLEEIDLSESNISLNSLQSILHAAPHLKKINLSNCKTINGELKLQVNSLQQLEEIDVSFISIKNLQSILVGAPNLKKINLSHFHTFNDELELRGICLQQLEEIELSSSNLSINTLQTLLAAAPNLNDRSKNKILSLISDRKSQSDKPPRDAFKQPFDSRGTPVNPQHDPNRYHDFKPTNKPFDFTGENKTKNQGMIIEKLCQYLTLTQQHLDVIPKIQDGICLALSHYFLELETSDWDNFVTMACDWNGKEPAADELARHFNMLYDHIKTHQLLQFQPRQYLGDALPSFLNTKKSCMLTNPWHAISIKPAGDQTWLVYDPNYVNNYQTVSQQNLLKTIHDSLGSIVSTINSVPHECLINDPNDFIANGGLLALCRCNNANEMLSQLPSNHQWSIEALDGIFLRNMSGKPAWVIGLASKNASIRALTQTLKHQFECINQDMSAQRLAKSLEALTPAQQGECITTLVQTPSTQTQNKALIASIRNLGNQERYENALKTWDKARVTAPSILKYCHQCLSRGEKKQLIELGSSPQVDLFRWHLEKRATNRGRAVFYIDKPDDLICSAPWIKKHDDNTGTLFAGPGGPLYDFLQENQEEPALLIVNYDNFNADDIIRFNRLLDKEAYADTTPLPKNIQIVGLLNRNKPDLYQGSDFYSRFNSTTNDNTLLQSAKPSRVIECVDEIPTDTPLINLYHAPDWEERLLGRWILNGDTLTFSEGELVKAIESGKSITIQNGLWGEKTFERFWQQALQSGVRQGERILHIPEHIKVIKPETEAYAWTNLPECAAGLSLEEQALVLNPTNQGDFLGRYVLQDSKLIKTQGFIEESKNSRFLVNVTRTLSDDAWAMLLDECTRHNVSFVVHAAPGVKLPNAFGYDETEPALQHGLPEHHSNSLIISTDIDASVALLTKDDDFLVIDISECSPSDLLIQLDGKLNKESLRFEFNQSNGALITALSHHKKIILKGHFSEALMDALAPYLLKETQSSLILVTDDKTSGTFISNRYSHQVSVAEKQACFGEVPNKLQDYFEKESLSQLNARKRFLRANPHAIDSDEAWLGMKHIPLDAHGAIAKLDKTRSAVESATFTKARVAQVNAVLDEAPYVFLTGLSGVGKTTFVEHELCKKDALYLTEEKIEAWAQDTSNRRKILFLDEANLSPRQWSEFEGLFNTSPSIRVNRALYPLTPHHKVVFAGNPVNYGDERALAPFFQRHGQAVLFKPLPAAVIYEKMLKPVFHDTGIDLDEVSDRILEVYHFICECSTSEVLISPRELHMMALLIITRKKQHPEQDLKAITHHFTYELAKNLAPKNKRFAFDQQFKPTSFQDAPLPQNIGNDFFATPSRHIVLQQMNDLLDLRAWRREHETTLNLAQKSGGLGGVILEGEPGTGKSQLVISVLRAHGYEEEHDLKHPSTKENPFYQIPVSMPLSEKEDLLVKAFNEGAVVMIDEINSSPMMERLLNDLLMGKNPRGKKEDEVRPGFMLIGTQNPVTMAGRRAASTALQRRLIHVELPEYQPEEIKAVLLKKGVTAHEAEAMMMAYEKNRAYAIKHQLSPAPNFRDLIELADEHLKNREPSLSPTGVEFIEEVGNLNNPSNHTSDTAIKPETPPQDTIVAPLSWWSRVVESVVSFFRSFYQWISSFFATDTASSEDQPVEPVKNPLLNNDESTKVKKEPFFTSGNSFFRKENSLERSDKTPKPPGAKTP